MKRIGATAILAWLPACAGTIAPVPELPLPDRLGMLAERRQLEERRALCLVRQREAVLRYDQNERLDWWALRVPTLLAATAAGYLSATAAADDDTQVRASAGLAFGAAFLAGLREALKMDKRRETELKRAERYERAYVDAHKRWNRADDAGVRELDEFLVERCGRSQGEEE